MQQQILTIIISIFGGGALLKFIKFLISRKDKKVKEKDEIFQRFDQLDTKIDNLEISFNSKLDGLYKEFEYDSANNARIRILKFSEETQRGKKHSKESFDQVHSDIDKYNAHCQKYPEYPNARADMAIKHIEEVYLQALELEKNGEEGFLS